MAWLEVHSENFFAEGGPGLDSLEQIRRHYPISLHGVGLSLGSTDPLDERHLAKLTNLVRRIEPALVSEHLSWGAFSGWHLNDLLPVPCTNAALEHMVQRVECVQERLRREILIENISSYVEFTTAEMSEAEFLRALVRRTGCGILLDLNNLYVNERNHGRSARAFIDAMPAERIAEIHLAGHDVISGSTRGPERDSAGGVIVGRELLIDTHGSPVCEAVWTLFGYTVERIGPRPTLIEWDTDVPELATLLGEAHRAQRLLERIDDLAA